MSTPENEEVAVSETPVETTPSPDSSDDSADAATGSDDGSGVVDASADAPMTTEADDESLDIEVEAEDEEDVPVEVDPIAELEAKLAEAEKGKKENYDRFVRTTADLENVRKRSRREVKDGRLDERGKILRDMLPVVDNLDLAVEHAQQNDKEATKSIVEGVEMVLRLFRQSLERHNVKALDAMGTPFDPAVHEAVSQAPSAEFAQGTVMAVLQTGYMMEERLLRPALVVVATAMPEAPAESSEETTESDETSVEGVEAEASTGAVDDAPTAEAADAEAVAAEAADSKPTGKE